MNPAAPQDTCFRPGDVLRVSCPDAPARVAAISREHISLQWPWWQVDPACDWIHWNGQVALPRPSSTSPGSTASTRRWRPGRLPRPHLSLTLLRAGEAHHPELEEQGEEFVPEDDIPFVLELLWRPCAFLETGDEVADAAGRAWRFDGPWTWEPFDGTGPHTPVWPLTLLTREGAPLTSSGPDPVARATATGSHTAEAARWQALTGASPPCAEPGEGP
ncbi:MULTISPECIES: hypothetical protein [unclassified Streptomyces]|uniref:hypothetical protein n=1 Tax=unclassified Streptomyces TaxID=2593676 RepID=UPI0023662E7A|nr:MULTISPECIES: hypothetical protein [unclassified Streptomyces]MDF3145133.1 hypothetical protein [Streptomyces sp. T21Q-yed]WDF43230.1 hypothetical protein PBV52_43790 [Streptomyces sp. T12]